MGKNPPAWNDSTNLTICLADPPKLKVRFPAQVPRNHRDPGPSGQSRTWEAPQAQVHLA